MSENLKEGLRLLRVVAGNRYDSALIKSDHATEILRHIRSLEAESELYRRGYKKIGACDISNYLARCETAGKLHLESDMTREEIDELARYIVTQLPEWEAAAGHAAQVEQNPDTGDLLLAKLIADEIEHYDRMS